MQGGNIFCVSIIQQNFLVSSLDWLRRRKRPGSEERISKEQEERYVGNTLLKQKPRLRVRNANLANNASQNESPNTPEISPRGGKACTLPANISSPESSSSSTTLLTRLNSIESHQKSSDIERSDMEQVFINF